MFVGGAFPHGTSFGQVYPILKALITSNSAKRQGVPDEEFIGTLVKEMQSIVVPEEESHEPRGFAPEQRKHIEEILMKDTKMVEDWARASSERQAFLTPPGIEVEEASEALAKRHELSAIVVEKLQMSAKSFGTIRFDDDIDFIEKEFVNLEPSGTSFGLATGRQEEVNKIPEEYAEQFLKHTMQFMLEQRIGLLTKFSRPEEKYKMMKVGYKTN